MTASFSSVLLSAVITISESEQRSVIPPEAGPTTVVFAFVEAVELGHPSHEMLFDFDAFARRHAEQLGSFDAAEVKRRMFALVSLPIRHGAAPAVSGGGRPERTEYTVVEEHHGTAGTSVSLTKKGEEGLRLKVRFELSRESGRWLITDMRGWYERHVLDSCARADGSQ